MKKLNKLLALALAVILTLSLCTGVFADNGSHEADLTGHTYTAYQIFSGTQTADSAELGDIVWGDGINDEDFLEDLQGSTAFGSPNIFKDAKTAKDVAEAIATANKNDTTGQLWANDSAEAKAFAKLAEDNKTGSGIAVVNGQTQLDPGYYLVVDTTETVPVDDDADDVYNLALLQLTKKGTFDINVKVEVPEVIKKIVEGDDKVDSNTAAIGDVVNYEISSKVPAKAADYNYYYFIARDTLTAGLTFNEDIAVTIGGDEAEEGVDYTVKTDADAAPYTFQVALIDAKTNAGKAVVITYTATVNENAVIVNTGNANTVDVEFSNQPDFEYDGTPDEDYPGFPDSNTPEPTGETPEDYTITYVTGVKLIKVDENGARLTGAEFTITGNTLNITLVATEVFKEAANGETPEYYELNAGGFTKDAPVTADKMEEAVSADKGYVEAEADYTGSDKITIGSTDYRAFKPATDTGKTVYILVKANSDLYKTTEPTHVKKTEFVANTATGTTKKVVGAVDENGVVTFKGLNAGDYTIEETKVPAGYNKMTNIDLKITCTLPEEVTAVTDTCTWTATASNAITDENETGAISLNADNVFELTIENKKGSTLPETGGIGTTIFYVIGGILLVGAAVLLITKKRMGAEA